MKRCLFLILIAIFPLPIFALSSRSVDGSFNPNNSASVPFLKEFQAYSNLKFQFNLPSSPNKLRDIELEGAVSSQNFSLLASVSNLLKKSNETLGDVAFVTKINLNFFASLKISKKASIGLSWDLGTEKSQDPVNSNINFFNLFYCLLSMHNSTGNIYNKSSFSFYSSYYDGEAFSLSLFFEDFLLLDTNELNLNTLSITDGFGINITSSSPKYNSLGALRMFQVITRFDCLSIFVEPILEPSVEFRTNVGLDKSFSITDKLSLDYIRINTSGFMQSVSNIIEFAIDTDRYSGSLGITSPLTFNPQDGVFAGYLKFKIIGN